MPPTPSQTMRILLASDSFPPLLGGAGRDTDLLARALASRGHQVCVATTEQAGASAYEASAHGFEIHRLPGLATRMHWLSASLTRRIHPPFPDPETALRMRRLIKSFRPQLVHSYGWITYSCRLAMVGLEAPLVVSARDYGLICSVRTLLQEGEVCSGPALGKCLACAKSEYGVAKGVIAVGGTLAMKRPTARRSAAVHSVSRYMDDRMVRHFLAPDALLSSHTVIPSFNDPARDGEIDERALSRLPREPFILYVGALRLCKGIDVLVRAHAQLEDPPPLVLLGPLAPDTPAAFPPAVHVLPATNHATVMSSWERALFAVAPSRLPEPFGNVVHEAMSRGTPVIGTRPGGHEDIINSGEDGLLVPSGDQKALTSAMAFLLGNQRERERMGNAARGKAARFSPKTVLPDFEALYRRVLARV